MKRVNFVADRVGNLELPGVQDIVNRLSSTDTAMTAEALVDRCLEEMGPLNVSDLTRKELVAQAESGGPVSLSEDNHDAFAQRVAEMLSLIAATREYQFG